MAEFSMPAVAPLYPDGPYEYDGFTAVVFEYPVERERLEQIVPAPLSVRRGTMSLGVYDYGVVNGFGSYNELLTGIPVTYDDRPLTFSPYLLLDGDAPLAAGREVWGIPKKLGTVRLETSATVITAVAERGGVRLLDATVEPHQPAADPPVVEGRSESVYRKTIPAATAGAAPVVDRLVVAETRDISVDRALTGPGTIQFTASAADPMDRFRPDGDPKASFITGSWVLDRTADAVLHRYEESA